MIRSLIVAIPLPRDASQPVQARAAEVPASWGRKLPQQKPITAFAMMPVSRTMLTSMPDMAITMTSR